MVEKEDKFGFFNMANNTYIHEYKNKLDGTGGNARDNLIAAISLFTIVTVTSLMTQKQSYQIPNRTAL